MTASDGRKSSVRLEIAPGSILLLLMAVAGAVLAARVLVAARIIASWVVACAVAAALIELFVEYLDRYVKRAIAIVLVLAAIGGIAGFLVWSVFGDLDHEVRRVQADAPVAAQQLEGSKHIGKVAQSLHLHARVENAVEALSRPSSGLAGRAVSSVGAYAVCIVLTILFLSWGPRVTNAAINQLNPARAKTARATAQLGFRRTRIYILLSIAQSAAIGVIAWFACYYAGIPAPAPLAISLAVLSFVPNLGVMVGALPILLLSFGLGSTAHSEQLTALFLALQIVSAVFIQPRIVRQSSLHVGPAITTVAFLVGFELYGIGGALYAAALVVYGVAAIDASAELVDADADLPIASPS